MIYNGNFYDTNHLLQTVCFSFQQSPAICQKLRTFQSISNARQKPIKNFFIKLSIFFFSLSCLAIFSLYFFIKKKQQQDLRQDLQKKIDQALSEYYNSANQTYYRNK
jgi:hypothetical protein